MVEEVVVTGSRIARDNFSSSDPINSYGIEELRKSALASVDEVLKEAPAFTGYQMGVFINNGNDHGSKKSTFAVWVLTELGCLSMAATRRVMPPVTVPLTSTIFRK